MYEALIPIARLCKSASSRSCRDRERCVYRSVLLRKGPRAGPNGNFVSPFPQPFPGSPICDQSSSAALDIISAQSVSSSDHLVLSLRPVSGVGRPMATVNITQPLDALKRVLADHETTSADNIYSTWNALYRECEGRDSPQESRPQLGGTEWTRHWTMVLRHNVVGEILTMAKQTIEIPHQEDDVALSAAVQLAFDCLGNAVENLHQGGQRLQRKSSDTVIKVITAVGPSLVASWWSRFRHLASSWMTYGPSLTSNLTGATALCHHISEVVKGSDSPAKYW